MHYGDPLVRLCVLVNSVYFDCRRLEKDGFGGRKLLVEAGSDADFRALNARDAEAQAAGRNLYAQRYLDTSGLAGDLRVSTVVAGDPVIVGTVFVHQRV